MTAKTRHSRLVGRHSRLVGRHSRLVGRHSRLVGRIALFLFCLAILAGAYSLFGGRPPEVRVPKVVGLTEPEALAQLAAVGLEADTRAEYRIDAAPGRVLRTAPEGGRLVRRGRSVRVYVAAEAPKVAVPDLVGRTLEDAEAYLDRFAAHRGYAVGFKIGAVTRVAVETAEAGTVLSQTPRAGETKPLGTLLHLVVAAETATGTIVVPNLQGQPLDEAQRLLFDVGLVVGEVRKQDVDAPQGTILAVSPPPGSEVEPGTPVDLVVAGGALPLFGPSHRRVPITYTVPEGAASAPIRVEVEDADGVLVLYEGEAAGGQVVSAEVEVRGEAQVRVFRADVEVASWRL